MSSLLSQLQSEQPATARIQTLGRLRRPESAVYWPEINILIGSCRGFYCRRNIENLKHPSHDCIGTPTVTGARAAEMPTVTHSLTFDLRELILIPT
ncbi:hypothetical protein LOK49_LG12G00366 [Camellia lanceoleosa]|uniref:Uncharacterized protein n=1 Tax=Camellia lanceoleosa TaxID=1840588 RepID=A0ACC0FPW4_9ERIC|nr:hypothetical protein LOK49_LG12G00366 [Camellia lanceoleosa]